MPLLSWGRSAWRMRLFHRDGVFGGGRRRRDCTASHRRDSPELAGCPLRRLRPPIASDPLNLPRGSVTGPSPAVLAPQVPSRSAVREARPQRQAGPAPPPQWPPPGPAPRGGRRPRRDRHRRSASSCVGCNWPKSASKAGAWARRQRTGPAWSGMNGW